MARRFDERSGPILLVALVLAGLPACVSRSALGVSAVRITQVNVAQSSVAPGDTNVQVQLLVENQGRSALSLAAVDLAFAEGTTDRAPWFSVRPNAANATGIDAGASVVLSYAVDVSSSAQTATITLDAQLEATDPNQTLLRVEHADAPAQLAITEQGGSTGAAPLALALGTITVGKSIVTISERGIAITASVANNSDVAVDVTALSLSFAQNAASAGAYFTVYPQDALPQSIAAHGQFTFSFLMDVHADALAGDVVVDATADAEDPTDHRTVQASGATTPATFTVDVPCDAAADLGTTVVHDVFGDGSAVATYLMDGDATDLGGAHDGTVSGTLSWGTGVCYSQSAEFSSNGAYIATGIVDVFDQNKPYSISIWIKPIGNGGIWDDVYVGSTSGNGVTLQLRFRLDGTAIDALRGDGTAFDGVSLAVTNLFDGAWHHVAVTYDGTNFTIYHNATSSSTVTSTRSATNYQIYFGVVVPGFSADTEYTGSMDLVRIFNRTLTPDEVDYLAHETYALGP